MSPDDGVYRNIWHAQPATAPKCDQIYDLFEATAYNVTPGSIVLVPADLGRDCMWVKVRSGSAGIPIAQEADREFKFLLAI